MKAHELATVLLNGPDLEVIHICEGAVRSAIDRVWVANDGFIATASTYAPVYDNADRPSWAPTVAEEEFWCPADKKNTKAEER